MRYPLDFFAAYVYPSQVSPITERKQAPSPAGKPDGGFAIMSLRNTAKPEKSPAFQFYPNEYFGDANVQRMSIMQEGCYIRLMASCWVEGFIPADNAGIMELLTKPGQAPTVEDIERVKKCFTPKPRDATKLIHLRLDKEREKQRNWRDKCTKAGEASGHSRRKRREINNSQAELTFPFSSTKCEPNANSSTSSSTSSSLNTETPTESCPAVSETETLDTSPPAMTFPTQGKIPAWNLTTDRLAKWEELYPALDVEHECRKALDWIESNRPKTAKGMPAFLSRWLSRAADRPGGEIAGQREPPGAMRGWRDEPIPPHTLTEEQSRIMLGDD